MTLNRHPFAPLTTNHLPCRPATETSTFDTDVRVVRPAARLDRPVRDPPEPNLGRIYGVYHHIGSEDDTRNVDDGLDVGREDERGDPVTSDCVCVRPAPTLFSCTHTQTLT